MAAAPLTANQQNAFDLLTSQLQAWGLSSLQGDLRNLIVNGDTAADTLTLALSDTAAYKQRFAGNAIRVANGLQALTPAQYVATETQYRDILSSYGLPPGFYDSAQDLNDFIGKDISPSELDTRAKIAHDQYEAAPAEMKDMWNQYYGTKGDAIAAILDPNTAVATIQDRATQVQIGTSAAQNGLHVGQVRASQLQEAGVTAAQAQAGYGQIAQALPTDQAIANRFGTTFGQTDEENDVFLKQAAPGLARQTMYNEEEGLFKGHAGAKDTSLAVDQNI